MTSEFPASELRRVVRTDLRPAYVQIADQLRNVISANRLEPGTKLPVEPVLVEALGVARMTVREGVRLLRQEGVVRAEHGLGVFVAEKAEPWSPKTFRRLSEPAWREAVAAALDNTAVVGGVSPHEELWASNAVGVEASSIARVEVIVSDPAGYVDRSMIYVAADHSAAIDAVREALRAGGMWSIAVRGAGPGDGPREDGDLVVTRTATTTSGEVRLVALSRRSANWAVVTHDES